MEAKEKGLFRCITVLFFLLLLCETKIGFVCCAESFSLLRNVGLWYFKYPSHRVFLLLFSFVSKLSYLRLDLTDVVYKKDTWQQKQSFRTSFTAAGRAVTAEEIQPPPK